MFEVLTDRWVVGVDLYLVGERLQCSFNGYHCGLLAIQRNFASGVLTSVARS